jgi:hypothetical protein
MHSHIRILLSLAFVTTLLGAQEPVARFRVTPEVINPGLEAFTGTTGGFIGHSFLRNGGYGFEPVQFRNRFFAAADAENVIEVDRTPLTQYNSYREGMMDGAEVLVFRITNGKMNLVRRDTVAPGGHKSSGWDHQGGSGNLIAPDATRFTGGFESWSRPEVPYWFAIAAVDEHNRLGTLSAPVRIVRPARPQGQNQGSVDNQTVNAPRPGRNAPTGNADLPAPTGFQASFDAASDHGVFSWNPVPGAVGYRLLRSDDDPGQHAGYRLKLAGRATSPEEQIRAGDMIIVRKTMYEPSRRVQMSHRIYDARVHEEFLPEGIQFHRDEDPNLSWSFEKYGPDSPVEAGGETALRLDIRDTREFALQPYAYGPIDQDWWPQFRIDRDYVVEFWAKGSGSVSTLTFAWLGYYSQGANRIEPFVANLTGEWQKFSFPFRVNSVYERGPIQQFKLSTRGPGSLWLDNLRVRQSDTALGALTAEDEKMFRQAKLGALRTHNFIKTFRNTYSMEQLSNPAGASNGIYGNTLGQTLSIMETIGTRPWLQIEMHMSPDEWRGLVEFMAAPYDPAVDTPATKPWAAKRHAQGRAAPWTDAFDKIYFEISNETWNGLFAPWTFANMPDSASGESLDRGTVYGLFQEWVIDQLKSSPHWAAAGLDNKVEFVIGGWATQPGASGYGQRAIAASPRSRHHTIAAYNGGWDEGEGPMQDNDGSLQRILFHAPQVGMVRSRALAEFRDSEIAAGRGNWVNGVYEAGPGYALSGLNNQARMSPEEVETQARAMKSLASGTATLDSFLEKAVHGFVLNNFFTMSRGRTHWVSHTDLKNGGHPHLPFTTIQLFNHEGTGDLVKVETISVPTRDAPAYRRRPAGKDMPLVAVYATRQGDRYNVFVLSRRLDRHPDPAHDGFTPVEIELPFAKARSMSIHRLTGDPRAHNLDAEVIKIERFDSNRALSAPDASKTLILPVNKSTGADVRGLPPGSTFLYVFEGVE